jgi:lipopolysaccharide export system protein LptC
MRLRPLLITGTLALATWWLAHSSHHTETPQLRQSGDPGYYFNEATLDETDAEGVTNLTLHTRRALEDVARHAIQLSDLSVDYRAAPDSVWHLTADSGTMPLGSDVLTLRGRVELRSKAARAVGAVVYTETLALDRAHRIAATDDSARIDWPPHQLQAQGLRLDLARQTLALENSVHGTFPR